MKKNLNPLVELALWIMLGMLTITVELCMVVAIIMIGFGFSICQIAIDIKRGIMHTKIDIIDSHSKLWRKTKSLVKEKGSALPNGPMDPLGF